eukprot:GHVL01003696.1.p2 GENE.GHVL01003696.1~~GHVL01003696.1.p2  ORF type:complete len:188 (+),score=29.46 GHVL01003696.1:785-1348(+)
MLKTLLQSFSPWCSSAHIQCRGHKVVAPKEMIRYWKIFQNDMVEVNTGPEKGRQGVVQFCNVRRNTLLVEGINEKVLRLKDSKTRKVPKPFAYSNVNLVDPIQGCRTRISIKYLEDGTMLRISKKSGAIIPIPDPKQSRVIPPEKVFEGIKDTPADIALAKTYNYATDIEEFKNLRQQMTKYNHTIH